jgi:Protein of unknown function (DUF2938)
MGSHWRLAIYAAAVGLGATATMDLGAEAIRRITGTPPLDYRLLARWIGHMPKGRFTHPAIADAEPVCAEKQLGLLAHYLIGVGFAGLLVVCQPSWARRPTLVPAMIIGLGSTAAPFFLMQPAFGLGVAASKTRQPNVVRLRSLRTHATYGLGLYLTGRTLARFAPAPHAT